MYVRKPEADIKEERVPKKGTKGAIIYAAGAFLFFSADFKYGGPHGHNVTWEFFLTIGIPLALLIAGVVYFFMKHQFAYTGNFKGNNDLVCLNCQKVFVQRGGYSANALLAFGPEKKKWWQIQACKTPDHCDIANMNDVNWVDDESDEKA